MFEHLDLIIKLLKFYENKEKVDISMYSNDDQNEINLLLIKEGIIILFKGVAKLDKDGRPDYQKYILTIRGAKYLKDLIIKQKMNFS